MIETEKGPGLENMLTSICRVVFYAIGVFLCDWSHIWVI